MVDIFSTSYLARLIPNLKTPSTWLLDTFFPGVIQSDTQEIVFDRDDVRRRLPPFVSPLVEGKIVESRGFTADTFKPAYVKDKRRFDPRRPIKRTAGEALTGALSIEDRRRLILAQEMQDQMWMLNRVMEWMASSVLRTGSVTVTGEKYPTQVVNFGRNSGLTVALTGTAKWNGGAAAILDNLQDWSSLVQQTSGAVALNVIMGVDVWKVFRKDPTVSVKLTQFKNDKDTLTLGATSGVGGQFKGYIDNFAIWVYQDWYYDETSQGELPIWPAGTVCVTGPDLEGTRYFGAILDEEATTSAGTTDDLVKAPYFTKSWVTPDPAVRWLMMQSAPLVVPGRPNAALCATVL